MSPSRLEALCGEWQKTLRLQDWQIECRFASVEETDRNLGLCHHLVGARTATIEVLRPIDARKADLRQQDIEDTVVHELLHCHFAPFFTKNKAVNIQQEQAIESIAGALVAMKRGRR